MDSIDLMIDPSAVMQIKNLQLRAKVIVEGFFSGLHRSPLHGASVEFSEYRAYSPGDDVRGVDWKLFARSDRYFIKKFEDETNRDCHLIVDQSRSMGFGSLDYTKIQFAQSLAASLAYYLLLHRDRVGLMTLDSSIADVVPCGNRTGHLRRLLACLAREVSGDETDLLTPLGQVAALTRRRGLVVMLSDCLTPIPPLEEGLKLLRSRGHEVIILRVLDPGETTLSMEQASELVDMETGRRFYVDPQTARDDYVRAFEEHQTSLVDTCDRLGVHYYRCLTNEPLKDALSGFVLAHQRRVLTNRNRR